MPRGGQGTRLVGALGQDQAAHGGGGSGLGISSSPLDRDTSLRHASSETPGKGRAKGGANVSESPAQALDDASFDYGFSAIETTQPTASSPSAPGRDSASKKTKGSRRTTGREPVPLGAKIPDTSHYAAAPKPAADPRQQLQNELNRETVRSMKQRTASAHHDGDLDQYGATKPPTPRRTQHAVGSPSAIVSSPSKRAADPAPVKIGWNHSTGTPFATAQNSSYDDLYQHTQTTQRENNAGGSPDAITKSSRGGSSSAYAAVGHRANGQPVAPPTSSHGAHQTSSSSHRRQPAAPGVGGTLFNNDKGARSDRDHTLALARDEASASTRRALYSTTGGEELSPFTAREKALREENENNSYQTVSSDAAYHPGGGSTSASGYRHKVSGGVVGRESGPAFDTTAEEDQIQAAINASLISASEEEITRHTEQRSEAEADAFSPSRPENVVANATTGDEASNLGGILRGENKEGATTGQVAPENGAGELSSAAPPVAAAASTPEDDPKLEEMKRKFGPSSRMVTKFRLMKNAGLGNTNGAAATTFTDGAAATPPANGDVLPLDGDPKPSIPSAFLQRRRDRSPAHDDIYDTDEGAGNGRRGPRGEAAAQRKSLFHHRANTAYGGASAPPPLATSRNTDPRSYNGRVGDNGSSSAYSYNASSSPYSYSSPAYTLPKSFNPPASAPSKYSLNPIKITDTRRMAGLANIGNSCYAGATLSLLFQDTTIRTAALKGHETLFYNAAMALHDGLEQFIEDTKTATKTEEGEAKREDEDGAPSTDGRKKGETEEALSVVKAESQKWSTADSVIQPVAIFKHYQKYAARVEQTVSREQRTATWTKHQKSVAVHRALSSIIQNGCLGGKSGESPDRTPRPLQSTQLGTFFLDGMQHDAHEFLVALFMRIQAEEAEIRLRRTQPEVFEQHAAAVAAWESKHQELPPATHGSSATVVDSSAGDMSAPTAFTFSQTQPDSHHSFYGHAGGGAGGGGGYDDDPLVAADDYENGGGSRNRSRERSPQFSDDESWMNTTIKSEKKHPVRKDGGAYADTADGGAGLGLASFEQQKCDAADLTQERIEAEKRQMEADAAAAQSERKSLGVSGMLSSMMPRSLRLKPPAAKPAAPTPQYETVHEWNRPQPDADETSECEESLCRASESTGRFEDARSEPEVIEEHEITDQGVAEERTMSDLGGGGGILVDDSTPGTTDQRASRRPGLDMDPAVPACGGQVLVDDSTSSEDDLCKPEFRPSPQHLKNPRVEELDDGSSEDAAVPLDKSCVEGGAAQPSTGQSVKQLLDDEVAQIEAEDEDAPLSTILHKRRREVMPMMRGPNSASERSPQKGRMPEKSAEANVKTEATADAITVDGQTGMDKTVDTTSVCATRGTDSASPCSPQAYEVPSFATKLTSADNDGTNYQVQASSATVEGGAGQKNSVLVIPDTQAMVDGGGSADPAVSKESSVSRVPAETPRPPDDPMDMFSHADKEAAEDECWLSQLVQGRVVERTECKHNACGHVQTKRDRFTVLSIPCKTSVAEGVRAFLSEEEIDSYKCDRCKTSGKQFMTTTFESLPTKLFVHLKRFSMRVLAGRVDMVKNNAFVSADPTLRLQETRTVIPPAATSGKGRAPTGPVVTEQVTRNYRLSGVVQHHGMSLSAGHYTARVLCDDDGKWYELDDSAVSSSQAPHPSSNLYILEYTLVAAEGEP